MTLLKEKVTTARGYVKRTDLETNDNSIGKFQRTVEPHVEVISLTNVESRYGVANGKQMYITKNRCSWGDSCLNDSKFHVIA